jgi:hypothetical protein
VKSLPSLCNHIGMNSADNVLHQPQHLQQKPVGSFKLLKPLATLAAVFLIALVAGTGGYLLGITNNQSASSLQAPTLTQPTQTVVQPSPTSQDDQMIVRARNDLANRLNIQPDSIQIVVLEKVVWPDTCLGAPKQSNCGVKVDVPGYKVIFQALGQKYEYHTGGEYHRSVE